MVAVFLAIGAAIGTILPTPQLTGRIARFSRNSRPSTMGSVITRTAMMGNRMIARTSSGCSCIPHVKINSKLNARIVLTNNNAVVLPIVNGIHIPTAIARSMMKIIKKTFWKTLVMGPRIPIAADPETMRKLERLKTKTYLLVRHPYHRLP